MGARFVCFIPLTSFCAVLFLMRFCSFYFLVAFLVTQAMPSVMLGISGTCLSRKGTDHEFLKFRNVKMCSPVVLVLTLEARPIIGGHIRKVRNNPFL